MTHLSDTVLIELRESVTMELTGDMPPSLRAKLKDFLWMLQRRRRRLLDEEASDNWTARFRENERRIGLCKQLLGEAT